MTEWRWYVVVGAFLALLASGYFLARASLRLWKKLFELDSEYKQDPEKYRTLSSRYAFMFRHCGAELTSIVVWLSVFFLSILISFLVRN